MKGEIRQAFGYSAPYPLATLPIDNDILEDKWGADASRARPRERGVGKMVKPRDESVRARFAGRVSGPQFFCSRVGGFRQNDRDHRTHFVDRAVA